MRPALKQPLRHLEARISAATYCLVHHGCTQRDHPGEARDAGTEHVEHQSPRAHKAGNAVELRVRDRLPLPEAQGEQLGPRLEVAAVKSPHVGRIGAQVDTRRPLA
jgi:hypothetical protein